MFAALAIWLAFTMLGIADCLTCVSVGGTSVSLICVTSWIWHSSEKLLSAFVSKIAGEKILREPLLSPQIFCFYPSPIPQSPIPIVSAKVMSSLGPWTICFKSLNLGIKMAGVSPVIFCITYLVAKPTKAFVQIFNFFFFVLFRGAFSPSYFSSTPCSKLLAHLLVNS